MGYCSFNFASTIGLIWSTYTHEDKLKLDFFFITTFHSTRESLRLNQPLTVGVMQFTVILQCCKILIKSVPMTVTCILLARNHLLLLKTQNDILHASISYLCMNVSKKTTHTKKHQNRHFQFLHIYWNWVFINVAPSEYVLQNLPFKIQMYSYHWKKIKIQPLYQNNEINCSLRLWPIYVRGR